MSGLTVWKQALEAADEQTVMVPAGAEFLTAQEQGGAICVWYRCEPGRPREPRIIAIRGTGHPHADGRYIGSAQLAGGALVFHVFEKETR